MIETNVVEIMSSIQGEGLFVGCRQVFIRFLGCNLACPYCDTPASFTAARNCRVEQTPGHRDFVSFNNPLPAEKIFQIITGYELTKHHSLSFTGGEPLLQSEFLQHFLPMCRSLGPKIFLETNGTLPENLRNIIELVDIISMDIKLTGNTAWQKHREFLELAAGKRVYVKLVILPDTMNEDIVRSAQLVRDIDPSIPLILQPVTPYGAIRHSPSPVRMIEAQDLALTWLNDVRVIPQTHKIIGQL